MRSDFMRERVKKYIDEADDQVVNMVYAMLKADREYDWWDELPVKIKKSIKKAEKELNKGRGIPHRKVIKGNKI